MLWRICCRMLWRLLAGRGIRKDETGIQEIKQPHAWSCELHFQLAVAGVWIGAELPACDCA